MRRGRTEINSRVGGYGRANHPGIALVVIGLRWPIRLDVHKPEKSWTLGPFRHEEDITTIHFLYTGRCHWWRMCLYIRSGVEIRGSDGNKISEKSREDRL